MKRLLLCLLICFCLFGCSSTSTSENSSGKKETVDETAILNFEALVNDDIDVFLDLKSSLRKKDELDLNEIVDEINERMDLFDAYYNSISNKNMTPEQKQRIKELADNYYIYLNLLLDSLEGMTQ